MTDNEVIYHIKQDKKLTEQWGSLSTEEKRQLLDLMQDRSANEIERSISEVKSGQNRLF